MTSDSRPQFLYSEPRTLRQALQRIDDCSYGSYGKIQGTYSSGSFDLMIDHVQKDPFAPPTLVCILIPLNVSGFILDLYSNANRRIGFCDYRTRSVGRIIGESGRVTTGSGNSGCLEIASSGQEIVERSSLQLIAGFVEARVYVGLPARGRRILAEEACALFLGEIPKIVEGALVVQFANAGRIRHHVDVSEDQAVMRSQLR
jgi:predicted ABC-class ATPase